MKVAAQSFDITPRTGCEGRSLTAARVEKVFGPLKTTVFLFEKEDTRLCLITSHFLNHYYRFSNLLRKRVADALQLPFDRVLSFSSHNHCAVKLVLDQFGFGKSERDLWLDENDLSGEGRELLQGCVAAARSLPDRLESVLLRWGLGHERRISYNRKGHRADGSTYMIREEDRLKLGVDFNGDIDDDAVVVGFYADGGRPLCFLSHFTAHPVTAFDPEHPVVFGEYSQVACDILSKAFGNVPVGFLQGCAGDVNAKGLLADKPLAESVADSTRYGQWLGQTWIDAAGSARPSASDVLALEAQIVSLPYAEVPPSGQLDAQIAELERFLQRCAADDPDTRTCQGLNFPRKMSPHYRAVMVEPLLRWARFARSLRVENRLDESPDHAEYEVTAIRLGDVGVVGMSCEPFDAIGRQIKRASPLPLTLPCGYMHDTCMGYVPDSGNNGDIEYMSAFYRYTTTMLAFAQPAGDLLAQAGLAMLERLAKNGVSDG